MMSQRNQWKVMKLELEHVFQGIHGRWVDDWCNSSDVCQWQRVILSISSHFFASYGKIKTRGLGMMKHFFLVRSGTQKGFQVLCIDSTNPLVVVAYGWKFPRGLSFFRALTSFWLTKKPWFQLLWFVTLGGGKGFWWELFDHLPTIPKLSPIFFHVWNIYLHLP